MGFKEQTAEDMAVFFHCDEFADLHTINGREVAVVMDNDTLEELYISKETETDQLFTDSLLFYVPESELDFEPVPGQYIDFDGRGYLVTDVKYSGGLYIIVMGVNGH